MNDSLLMLELEHPADLEVYREGLAQAVPNLDVRLVSSLDEAMAAAPSATILAAKAHSIPQALIEAMPRLEWIQALTTGTDHLATLQYARRPVVTSARGVHGPQMSELALLLMMSLARDLPRMLANQQRGAWERWPQRLLFGKTVTLVGAGAISEELAHRCRAFGMHVIGISSTRNASPGCDEVHPRTALAEVARRTDYLVLLVPYSTQTHHLVDAQVLSLLPSRACVVNIARGNVIDERALIDALRTRQIAGAGLDVFATEPPAPDNPLWTMPNVIMTPRIGGMSDTYARQILPLLLENLRHYLDGDRVQLRNIVDLANAH